MLLYLSSLYATRPIQVKIVRRIQRAGAHLASASPHSTVFPAHAWQGFVNQMEGHIGQIDDTKSLSKKNTPINSLPNVPLGHIPPAPSPPRSQQKLVAIPLPPSLPLLSLIPPPPPMPLVVKSESATKVKKKIPIVAEKYIPNPYNLSGIFFFPLAALHLISGRKVIIDTEATGLGDEHRLTEVCCVEMVNLQSTGHMFWTYCNPGREVNSEAHQITGLTWNFLRKYPPFYKKASHFLTFITGAQLVFHHAAYDLKLLNRELKEAKHEGMLEKQHDILDTLELVRKLHPHEKNDANAVFERYGVGARTTHGAFVDATKLAEAFRAIIRQNESLLKSCDDFSLPKPKTDFTYHLQEIKNTMGEKMFRDMGITQDLPSAFRFVPNMYHPQLHENYPATVVKFSNHDGKLLGIYVRYYLSNYDLNQGKAPKQKIFFGIADTATIDIHLGNNHTIFIGNITNALVAKEMLLGEYGKSLADDLNIKDGFSIKACLDLAYLPSLTFDDQTKQVIILAESDGKNDAILKQILIKSLERFSVQHPQLVLKVILMKTELDGKTTVTDIMKKSPKQLANHIRHVIPVRITHDWVNVKTEQARRIYVCAQPIQEDASVMKYFRKRGITCPLPDVFRYLNMYFPGLNRELPAAIIPMFNKAGDFSAVHRIFCYPDGNQLPRRAEDGSKIPTKLSIGKAVEAAAEVYKGTISCIPITPNKEPEVVLISEGVENAMVAKDVMLEIVQKNRILSQKLYANFNMTNDTVFSIKAGIGVNDLINIPFSPKRTHTMIILADNDGRNPDVKRTIRETVEFFLQAGLIVKIALPEDAKKEKVDLNDVYLQAKETERVEKIAAIFCDALTIKSSDILGNDEEPLQTSLRRIRTLQMPPVIVKEQSKDKLFEKNITLKSVALSSSKPDPKNINRTLTPVPVPVPEPLPVLEAKKSQPATEETIQTAFQALLATDGWNKTTWRNRSIRTTSNFTKTSG